MITKPMLKEFRKDFLDYGKLVEDSISENEKSKMKLDLHGDKKYLYIVHECSDTVEGGYVFMKLADVEYAIKTKHIDDKSFIIRVIIDRRFRIKVKNYEMVARAGSAGKTERIDIK